MPFDNSSRAGYEKYYSEMAESHGWKSGGHEKTGGGWWTPPRSSQVYVHYNFFHFGQGQVQLAQQMKTAVGLDNAPVALIGAGFGWTGEGLVAAGTSAVVGTEISPYILSAKDTSDEQDIRDYCARVGIDPDAHWVLGPPNHPFALFRDGEWIIRPLEWWNPRSSTPRSTLTIIDEDGSTGGSRGQIRNALGDDIHHIITEELLNSVTDAEALTVCGFMESIATSRSLTPTGGADVFHMLSPLQNDLRQSPDLNWKTYADWRALLDANGFSSHKIICTVPVQGRSLFEVM